MAFALRHPGRFRLMFRGGVLRPDATLDTHGHAAFHVLEHGVRRAFGLADDQPTSAAACTAVLALWPWCTAMRTSRLQGASPRCSRRRTSTFLSRARWGRCSTLC